MVSPLLSYNHIPVPQTTAANNEKYLESGGMGFPAAAGEAGALGINEAMTREQMYNVICDVSE
jgi:hypothetical protein